MAHLYRLMRDLFLAIRRAHLKGYVSAGVAWFSLTVGTVIALALGAHLYLDGNISIGSVYMVGFYASMLGIPLRRITDKLDELQQASAGLRRVEELHAIPVTISDGPGVDLREPPLSIELCHVTFGYNPDLPVLWDVSFRVEPATVLGLLGRTGSGKTTISRLLFRLYDAQQGLVRVGEHDVREFRVADLRRRVGLVTQDVQLFHATVRDNLTFFDERADDGRILEAIQSLGLGRWYESLPEGLDTELAGSGGLSAGEAQMLALTRVFLKNPDIVILDEASSRLDPVTERLIEGAIDTLLQDRTGIVIAHRLATVFRADAVLVLEGGRVVEHGPRAQLARDPGSRFAALLRTGLEEALA